MNFAVFVAEVIFLSLSGAYSLLLLLLLPCQWHVGVRASAIHGVE